jgi:Uma2 family endonuclease
MSVTVAISENPIVTVPTRATASLASFRAWAGDNDLPEKAKLCYHRGEVFVEMGKEQIFSHVRVKTEITRVLANIVKEESSGLYLTDGAFVTNEAAELSCNLDAVFVSFETIRANRVEFIEGEEGGFVELFGAADMVLEVVSDSSEKKDNQTLFEAYFDAGGAEYWLVDARGEEVEFHAYKRGAKKFSLARPQPGGWVKSAAFGRSFRLARGADATGEPEFTLEVK